MTPPRARTPDRIAAARAMAVRPSARGTPAASSTQRALTGPTGGSRLTAGPRPAAQRPAAGGPGEPCPHSLETGTPRALHDERRAPPTAPAHLLSRRGAAPALEP